MPSTGPGTTVSVQQGLLLIPLLCSHAVCREGGGVGICPMQLQPMIMLVPPWALLARAGRALPGWMSWNRDFQMVYCRGPVYLEVGKSSYVRLVSWIFPLRLEGEWESRLYWGLDSCPKAGVLQPCSGQLTQGKVMHVKSARLKLRCLLVPLSTSLAISLSFLIFKIGTSTCLLGCEDYMA